jgi:uncharacterized membrane protein YjgN (DUF898 family)
MTTGAERPRSLDEAIFGNLPPPPPPSGERLAFRYTGRGRDIIGLAALNALLNIVTLTLYRFWGKTRVRQHILARTEINNEPLEYTGTGWEMFRGFLIVLVLVLAPLLAGALLPVFYLVFGFLAYMAVYTARRYRFSRTTWRGIRFGMKGSAVGYAWASIGFAFLTSFTLGWYAPAANMRLSRTLWADTTFGGTGLRIRLDDNGLAGPTYPAFALLWIVAAVVYVAFFTGVAYLTATGTLDPDYPDLTVIGLLYLGLLAGIVLIALASVPYQAALMRRKAELVGFGQARFELAATTPSLFWLNFSNGLILLLTLGFGQPVASARTFRYVFNRLTSAGMVDLDAIAQSADRGPRSGEGLADAFDIGGF